MAPQSAKPRTSVRAAGWRERKAREDESSCFEVGDVRKGDRRGLDVGRRGVIRSQAAVRMVEMMFCATIICGPVNLPYRDGDEKT